MVLKSGLIRVGQKQMDRFSLVMRFTLLLWLTLRATPGSRSELQSPVLTVTVPPAALLPPPPPCKLRTRGPSPLGPSSEAPEVGGTALAVQKGSVCVPQQRSRNTTLSGEEQVWLESNPTVWE